MSNTKLDDERSQNNVQYYITSNKEIEIRVEVCVAEILIHMN